MSTAPAWISATIALFALVAVVIYGERNLRQARRGPDGAPNWVLLHANKSRYELVNNGSGAARNVEISVEPKIRVDGRTEFESFSVGQRASLLIAVGWGDGDPRVHVTWDGPKDRSEWSSDLPT